MSFEQSRNDIWISVIIPTFNREKEIIHSIWSVLRQTVTNTEVIVVDDASTDNTGEAVKAIQDKRIRYFKNKENKGVAYSRNIGVEQARGEFVAFNDSDDEWLPDKLEYQMRVFEEHPDYAMVFCPYELIRKGKVIYNPCANAIVSRLSGNIYDYLLEGNRIGTPTMIIKRKIFREEGGYSPEIKALDDWEFALRISKKYEVGYCDKVLVRAHYTDGSITRSSSRYKEHAKVRIKILKDHMRDNSKGTLRGMILQLLYEMAFLSPAEQQDLKTELIPDVFEEAVYLDIMLNQKMQLEYLIVKNRLFESFSDKENACRKIYSFLGKKQNRGVVVYGYGSIGKSLVDCLEKLKIDICYIVDRNEIKSRYRWVSPEDKLPEAELMVISIVDNNWNCWKKMKGKFMGEVIRLQDILLEIL